MEDVTREEKSREMRSLFEIQKGPFCFCEKIRKEQRIT